MPIRCTKHNSLLKNRKLAKARENKFVRVEWKDRRDVLVKPYEFDHPFIQRAPDGRVSRSYYEFTLRKNKTLLVVDINKLDTVSSSYLIHVQLYTTLCKKEIVLNLVPGPKAWLLLYGSMVEVQTWWAAGSLPA